MWVLDTIASVGLGPTGARVVATLSAVVLAIKAVDAYIAIAVGERRRDNGKTGSSRMPWDAATKAAGLDSLPVKHAERWDFTVPTSPFQHYVQEYIPLGLEPTALVFICPGYTDHSCWNHVNLAAKMVAQGYAVFTMDYEGHGQSEGLLAYVQDFDRLVDAPAAYFEACKRRYPDKKAFVIGESMGGAVALKLHLRGCDFIDGALLVAPMCKIAEDMKPPPIVIAVLKMLEYLCPHLPITPVPSVAAFCFKLEDFRTTPGPTGQLDRPFNFTGKPRLGTALTMLRTSLSVEAQLSQVTLPFIVLHGGADRVADSRASQALYDLAQSKDKSIRLYPGVWHGLLAGQPKEELDAVIHDMTTWLKSHR